LQAAIAVYESPQARQFAEDVRRRIAMALHSLGDEINPASQQPRYNRPEDAEGFMQSTGGNAEMDADEESKRRQREELMYWNAVHLEKNEKERKMNQQQRPANRSRGSSFEDFLQEDPTAEKGTFVYNTGADVHQAEEGLTHRRSGVQGLDRSSVYANPFADEHNIEDFSQHTLDSSLISPDHTEKYETMSDDLYTASEPSKYIRTRESTTTLVAKPEEMLIDTSEPSAVPDPPISLPVMEELVQEQNTLHRSMATTESPFASINAWADNTNNSFYSPLPTTPRTLSPHQAQTEFPLSPTFSDPSLSVPGSGEATPTDSMSMAGSTAEEVWQPRSGATSEADVISVDGDGISTPGSWTEVGSVVSENDIGVHY
jgi:hypothetical protein